MTQPLNVQIRLMFSDEHSEYYEYTELDYPDAEELLLNISDLIRACQDTNSWVLLGEMLMRPKHILYVRAIPIKE